jgi:hypothetical protein
MIGRFLLTLSVLAVAGFLTLVLVARLWGRYEAETVALGFSGIYERFQARFLDDSKAPAAVRVERARQEITGRQQGAPARVFQQGLKLVGADALGSTNQGMAVALSADGNAAIVGAPGNNNADRDRPPSLRPAGGAWVFTRRGGIWRQQGNKLVGNTSEYGGVLWSQGASVALSADGDTAIMGRPSDNRTTGAAWVFTRNGSVWTQQGNKLVGTGAYKAGEPSLPQGQGMSVALSADGNTAIVGGWRAEGAWVFTRNGGVWTQQGKKLVGTGAVGSARQGMSVALSADGNAAMVGGWADNSKTGAAWVFTRSNGVWTQQGKKLVGTDAVGTARQGTSVALSADGNTAIVGGPGDSPWDRSVSFGLGAAGAAWVFTRSDGIWAQQGEKLVSSGGSARQGMSVALSADGNIAVVGGLNDDGRVGAVSVFTRNAGHWREDKKRVGTGIAVGKSAASVALSADGSMVMVGEPNDNGGIGAAWVFTRSGGHWTQDEKVISTERGREGNSTSPVALRADATSKVNTGIRAAPVLTPNSGGSDHQESPPPSPLSDPAWNLEE